MSSSNSLADASGYDIPCSRPAQHAGQLLQPSGGAPVDRHSVNQPPHDLVGVHAVGLRIKIRDDPMPQHGGGDSGLSRERPALPRLDEADAERRQARAAWAGNGQSLAQRLASDFGTRLSEAEAEQRARFSR